MATPTHQHHHALRAPATTPIALASVSLTQSPMMNDRRIVETTSKLRRGGQYPLLPNIASLLNRSRNATELRNLQTRDVTDTVEMRKKKLFNDSMFREPADTAPGVTSSPSFVLQQRTQAHLLGDWDQYLIANNPSILSSVMPRAVYRDFQPRGVAGASVVLTAPVSRADVTTLTEFCCRVCDSPAECHHHYHQHNVALFEVQTPVSLSDFEGHSYEPMKQVRTSSSHLQWTSEQLSPARYEQYEDEGDRNCPKRRRVTHTPQSSCQSRCEPEYGLAGLETSKPRVSSFYPLNVGSSADTNSVTSRRHYARQNSNGVENITPSTPIGNNGVQSYTLDIETGFNVPRAICPQSKAETEKSSALATLIQKSKEFLKSKSLVRNRHDEVDWVATFLNVGFDSSSIYALMCPLRKGRWKSEEESYTMALLRLIENGTILLQHGRSIRGYIGEKLHSDDMRVLKKLSNCKMYHFAKHINPRLAEEESLDVTVEGARVGLEHLDKLKGEFLRSVQLEALVAVRKYLSDSSLHELLIVRT